MRSSKPVFFATLAAYFLPFAVHAQPAPQHPTPQLTVGLTAQEMSLVINGIELSPEARAQLASSAEQRRMFARDLRKMLALCEEARAAGYAARPDLSLRMELSDSFVIARAYTMMREATAKGPEQVVSPAEIEAFFKGPGVTTKFEAFLQDQQKTSSDEGAPLTDARRSELREHYGRVMVAKQKGIAGGLDRQRQTQLIMMLRQSRVLADAYFEDNASRHMALEPEIDAYLATHPELDTKVQRTKVEEVMKRARAGEDFAALANQFSTEPGGKEKGGDLGWFGRGEMVQPFEDAVFGLQPGEISGVVETQFGFHVIKLEERRTQNNPQGKPVEQVRARHIVIGYRPPRADRSGTLSSRDQASEAIEHEKRRKWIDGILARTRVVVAEVYTVGADAGPSSKP